MSALHDPELERNFLSACMLEPTYALACGVHPHEMGAPGHRDILGALLAVAERGEGLGTALVLAELGRRGLARHVEALLEMTSIPALPSPSFAPRLRQLAQGRAARDAALRLVASLDSGRIEEGLSLLTQAAEEVKPPEARESTSMGALELVERGVMMIHERNERRLAGKHVTITTGMRDLDIAIGDSPDGSTHGGWEQGDCVVIGGGTNVGKTSAAMGAAFAQAHDGVRVGIVSVEDGMQRTALRMLAMHTGIPQHALRSGHLAASQWQTLTSSSLTIAKLPMRFEFEVAATLASVCAAIRRLVREHGCQCIYVDYLQAIRPTDARLDTRTAIRDAIAECKRAATIGAAEPATLVLLSQMRRREQDTSMPSKSDLYESGYIEQKADHIVLLWQDDSKTLNAVLAKTKDGRLGAAWQLHRGRAGVLDMSGQEAAE